MRKFRLDIAGLLLAAGALAPAGAGAQGFSALVSPPRFEDQVKPGTVYRNVVEISNVSGAAAHYTLKTADWHLDAQGSAVFDTALDYHRGEARRAARELVPGGEPAFR